jgi:hypothetical protein
MSLIKEPIDVDFFVESKPLSKEEKRMISDFIIQYKKDNDKVEKKKTPRKSK